MNQIYDIRLMHNMEGKSNRSIARETGFDRTTISKYINGNLSHQHLFNRKPSCK
ncbi:XRE family transcriptional regulator [Atopobacter sp. AH10]|nr:XRE family transcriptional regulator [Atopobacter sp. AH10]